MRRFKTASRLVRAVFAGGGSAVTRVTYADRQTHTPRYTSKHVYRPIRVHACSVVDAFGLRCAAASIVSSVGLVIHSSCMIPLTFLMIHLVSHTPESNES